MYYIYNVIDEYKFLEIEDFVDYGKALNTILELSTNYPTEKFILCKKIFKNY